MDEHKGLYESLSKEDLVKILMRQRGSDLLFYDYDNSLWRVGSGKRWVVKCDGWRCEFYANYTRQEWKDASFASQKGYTGVIFTPDNQVYEVVQFHRYAFMCDYLYKLAQENPEAGELEVYDR